MSNSILPQQERTGVGLHDGAAAATVDAVAVESTEAAVPTEFDLHGFVGIRLVDADPADARAVGRQLGPIAGTLDREPDITIRFVDEIPTSSTLNYLGVGEAAFTDSDFLVLRAKHKARARVRIPFEAIGGRCEIVCEKGVPAVPLLIAIVNLTALAKGVLPLHASAFNYEGVGVLATGWSKGGKTESLLAFMARGASYVGDEWVYLSPGGEMMHGIPEPIRVWDWHLGYLPEYRALVGRAARARLGTVRLVESVDRAMAENGHGRRLAARTLRRAMPIVKKQGCVDMRPHELFGEDSCALSGSLDKVFFVASHASADVTVTPVNPRDVADRMVFSLEEERSDFMSYYRSFRFAFPEAANELIDGTEELQRELVRKAFADKEAYALHHPYPVALPALFDAMKRYCEPGGSC